MNVLRPFGALALLLLLTTTGASAQGWLKNTAAVALYASPTQTKVGIGTSAPLAKLHVGSGSGFAGAINTQTRVLFESNGSTWLSFLSPNAGKSGFLFGNQSRDDIGQLTYDNSLNRFNLAAGGRTVLSADYNGVRVGFTGNGVPTGYAFAVEGKAIMEEVRVNLMASWPDYVFEPSYALRPLDDLEAYVKDHGHLPDIPSAQEVAAQGIALGDMDARLLKKVEELTLYLFELKEQNAALSDQNEQLQQRVSALEQGR